MSPVGFEPTISASERSKTYTLDRAATGTGEFMELEPVFFLKKLSVTTELASCSFSFFDYSKLRES